MDHVEVSGLRTSLAYTGFNSGEWSPSAEGRTDVKGYATACFRLENFIPMVQGPARRRPGTRFVAEVKFSSKPTALMEFSRSVATSFMIEVGDFYMRFFKNYAPVLSALQPAWNATVGGTTGDGALTWTNRGVPHWAPTTIYAAGALIVDSNGNIQQAAGGTSSSSPPAWNTAVGGVTIDSFLWTNLGAPTWLPLIIYAANAVVYTSVGIQQVTAGGGGASGAGVVAVPYEIPTPWAASDLFDADGMFQLVFTESADVIYITHRSTTFSAYKLSHFGDTNWTLVQVNFIGGPFADANPGTNPVVFASAQTGIGITLTASADIFDARLVGAIFQLTQENIRTIRPWESGVIVNKGARRRFNGVTYEALNGTNLANSPPSPLTGSIPPTHLSGQAYDAGGQQGILWEYRDNGSGFVKLTARNANPSGGTVNITGITSAKPPVVTTATPTAAVNGDLIFIKDVNGMPEVSNKWYRVAGKSGSTFQLNQDDVDGDGNGPVVDGTFWDAYSSGGTVDNRLWTAIADVIVQDEAGVVNRLPKSVVFSQNATSHWAVGAFNNRDGYPSACAFFRGRLAFSRLGDVFISVAADYENFSALTAGGEATADMAIHVTLPTQDAIVWMVEGRVLVIGTESAEHVVQEINTGQAFGPSNIASKAQMKHGSRPIRPALINYSLLWVQTSGQKLRVMKYQFYTDQYQSEDLAALANHIFEKHGAKAMAFQKEPDSVVWMIRS